MVNQIQKPPFFLTYYNPFTENSSGLTQSFLNYIKDISVAEYTANSIGTNIKETSQDQIQSINSLNTSITSGFEMLDQRMAMIRLELINTNLLLQNIVELLKLPDSEKQRQRHIELGLKFSNAALKNKELIGDSLVEFNKALELMPQDWFVQYQLGMIHLYNSEVCDLSKAETLFVSAAKYSSVDTLGNSTLGKLFDENLLITEDIKSKNTLESFTAECYLQAALIGYIQTNFAKAVDYATKATKADKTNSKAFFLLGKYQSRLGNDDLAIEALRLSNSLNENVYMAFVLDLDLLRNKKFQYFYEEVLKDYKEKILLKNVNLLHLQHQRIFYILLHYLIDEEIEIYFPKDKCSTNSSFLKSRKALVGKVSINFERYKHNKELMEILEKTRLHILEAKVELFSEREYYKIAAAVSEIYKRATFRIDINDIITTLKHNGTFNELYEMNLEYTDVIQQFISRQSPKINSKKEGCFIATTVYGSYEHPIVMVFRTYRDNYLSKFVFGRIFVQCYYKISPFLVSVIKENIFLKNIIKTTLLNPIYKFLIRKQIK